MSKPCSPGSWPIWWVLLQGAAVCIAGPAPQGPATQLEDVERQVGPFQIKGQRFTVVLHEKHVAGVAAPDPESQTTLAAIEMRDQAGTAHYRESFRYEVSGHEFTETVSASVELLEGRESSGLLVTYGVLPSTPLGGQSWQVFGLFDGKLVPFSKPIVLEGGLVNVESGQQLVKTSEESGRKGETLHFRIWTGNFFVIYPVLVDWLQAKLMPAWRCFDTSSPGQRAYCPYRVEAERVPQEEELTFVRLHAEAGEGTGPPRHVVVRKDSKVDFLGCAGEVRWQQDEGGVGLTPGDDFWIRVRIDGTEGWIHTQEDLMAIGLPQAG